MPVNCENVVLLNEKSKATNNFQNNLACPEAHIKKLVRSKRANSWNNY